MTEQEKALRVLRDQIDSIDQQIQTLLNQRAECAQKVAEVKESYEGKQDAVFYRPEREAQVLRRVMDRNPGPLPAKEVAWLFREIMSICLSLEKPMRVAFLGPEGTFTQQAAVKHFGHSVHQAPMASLDQVFREVESGQAAYGIVPIENSTEGMATHTLDLFRRYSLRICGELELPIHHHLMMKRSDSERAPIDLASIQTVYAHRESLAQCRQWLAENCINATCVEVSSNAEGAQRAASEANSAALAAESAEELYDLSIVQRNVEDLHDNTTRFLVIGQQIVGPSGQDKTSVLLAAPNEPGALYKLLEPFHSKGISLTRIETRPSGQGAWSYLFYIDFEGHESDPAVVDVIKQLELISTELKVLGSYPKAVI
jgi:chorismate mutase/prephenate dehydratase